MTDENPVVTASIDPASLAKVDEPAAEAPVADEPKADAPAPDPAPEPEPAPDAEVDEAAVLAGWNPADGPAPYEHALMPDDAIVTEHKDDA